MSHTRGPWQWHWAVDHDGNADGRIFTAWNAQIGIGAPLCVAVSPRYQTKEQWEKDAPVLAAAPDMLEALEQLIDDMQAGHSVCEAAKQQAIAAIKKAGGEIVEISSPKSKDES